MSGVPWPTAADQLHLTSCDGWAEGTAGPYPAALTSRYEQTWLGLVVANPQNAAWTLTRRWEPQARNPRRPDERTVRFRDIRLTERYVGTADEPEWFRKELSATAADALVRAADQNRLGACSIELRGHVLHAKYRATPDMVPDLAETLESLVSLAECLDGDAPELPDLAQTALVRPKPSAGSLRADRTEIADRSLTFILEKPPGLLQRFQRANTLIVDWESRSIHGPDIQLPLDNIRQLVALTMAGSTLVECVDKAGAPALSVHVAGPLELPTAALLPPCVYADAGSR